MQNEVNGWIVIHQLDCDPLEARGEDLPMMAIRIELLVSRSKTVLL
jgi:hypothetical protein